MATALSRPKKITDLPVEILMPTDGRIKEFLNADFYYLANFVKEHVADPDFIYAALLDAYNDVGAHKSGSREIRLFSARPGVDTYSGIETIPMKTVAVIDDIRAKLGRHLGIDFDTCLLNYYRDGSAAIGHHSDGESDLLPNAPIASVSFGAVRHFDIWPKLTAPRIHNRYRIDLGHGSLMIMGKNSQREYTHSLPVQKKVKEPRINLTFRVTRPRED